MRGSVGRPHEVGKRHGEGCMVHEISQAPKQKNKFSYLWEVQREGKALRLRRGLTQTGEERPHLTKVNYKQIVLMAKIDEDLRITPETLQRLVGLSVSNVLAAVYEAAYGDVVLTMCDRAQD